MQIPLSRLKIAALTKLTYSFSANANGSDTANELTFINTQLTTDTTHVFEIDNLNVTGFDAGSNITVAGSTTITAGAARLIGGYYFGAEGTNSGTVIFNTASDIALTGNLIVDAVSGTTLVGLSNTNFTSTGAGTTFYLKDGGSNTGINALTFNEVSDSHISKLVYNGASEMGIYGAVALTAGSNTQMTYALGSDAKLADYVNSIDIGGMTYAGTGVSVFTSSTSMFNLTADEGALMTVTGSNTGLTYTLTEGSSGTFQFGGITIGGSNTGITKAVTVGINGDLKTNTSIQQITIGGALVDISDASGSSTYRIDLVGESMSGATISQIDNGAILYKVASATSVITTGSGQFTFSTTALQGAVSGTNTQIFSITGERNLRT